MVHFVENFAVTRSRSGLFEFTTFTRACVNSYQYPIATISLSCTVSVTLNAECGPSDMGQASFEVAGNGTIRQIASYACVQWILFLFCLLYFTQCILFYCFSQYCFLSNSVRYKCWKQPFYTAVYSCTIVFTARRVCIAWTMPWQDVRPSVTRRYYV